MLGSVQLHMKQTMHQILDPLPQYPFKYPGLRLLDFCVLPLSSASLPFYFPAALPKFIYEGGRH
jgi:hypothetical protein